MEFRTHDVALVTADSELEAAVRRSLPAKQSLLVLSPTAELPAGVVKHWWVDLDGAAAHFVAKARVLFVRDSDPVIAPCNVSCVQKPISDALASRLWSQPDQDSTDQRESIPGWIVDYHDLDLRGLTHKLVTRLPVRLGYEYAAVYLLDPTRKRLCLVDATDRRLADYDLAVAPDCPLHWATLNNRFVVGESAREACSKLGLCPPVAIPDVPLLIAPLGVPSDPLGAILFTHRAASGLTELGLPLGSVFSFLGRAVYHARRYDLARVEARIDALTGLYNYRWLIENLEREIRRAERFDERLSIALVDLDGMKCVNDRLGHCAGDSLLRQVADRIRAALRQTDTAARAGGDEFVILLPGADTAGAENVERRLTREIANIEVEPGSKLTIRASVGLAEWRPGWNVEHLLDAADRAMYEVKYRNRAAPTLADGVVPQALGSSLTAPAA